MARFSRFSHQNPIHIPLLTCRCDMPCVLSSWISLCNNNWWGVQIKQLIILQFSPVSTYLGDLYVYNIKIDLYLSKVTVLAVLIFKKFNYIMKYKGISKSKVTGTLMLRTLFLHTVYMAQGYQMVHIRPPGSHHWHLNICMAWHQGLYLSIEYTGAKDL